MTTVVMQAHPGTESFNAAMLDAATANSPDARIFRLYQGESIERADLADARALVAVYPTWWGGVPALMLRTLDELLAPWIDGGETRATSPLRTVRTLRVATSHGSSRRINWLQGNPGLNLWKRSVLPLCAGDAEFHWNAIYDMDRAGDNQRAAFLSSLR